ncbi:MAG: butyrate kinase [Bacillota bacterium]|jgi:butyrate kinase
MEKILVINPGSTSTKIAVYNDDKPLFVEGIDHDQETIAQYKNIADQYEMRKNLILDVLKKNNVDIKDLTAVVARGGLLPPVQSGAYRVNQDMVDKLKYNPQNEHASNLGAIIAYAISEPLNIPSFVYDPVTVDELEPIARITGLPEMQRKGMGHNLNMRASAIKYAKSINKPYNQLTLIVAHLGGGITLTLHKNGRMIDMISDDEGPFSPERAGGLPVFQVAKMITSGGYDYKGFMSKIKNSGGLQGYFGVKDARAIEKMIAEGNEKAALVYEALALNVAKNIAKLAPVVNGQVDAIILTGGIAYSKMMTDWITQRVQFIAPVVVLAGENEMESLSHGALRVLRGEEEAHTFVRQDK